MPWRHTKYFLSMGAARTREVPVLAEKILNGGSGFSLNSKVGAGWGFAKLSMNATALLVVFEIATPQRMGTGTRCDVPGMRPSVGTAGSRRHQFFGTYHRVPCGVFGTVLPR